MAKLVEGVLGGFRGKVGTVVGNIWKGVATMRVYVASISNPKTAAQLAQRAKFALMVQFMKPLADFVRATFKKLAIKKTAFNAAVSYNLKRAITGTYPDYDVDYTKVLVSQGTLPGALNPEVTATVAGEIGFTWEDNTGGPYAKATDKAALCVYNPAKGYSVDLFDGNTRAGGSQSVTLPANWTGDEVQCFIAFSNANGSVYSNSAFVGGIIVL
jgi:hypothetical protein